MSDKVEIRRKKMTRKWGSDRIGHYIMVKEDKAFLCIPYIFSIYIPSNKVANYVKLKLTEVEGKMIYNQSQVLQHPNK